MRLKWIWVIVCTGSLALIAFGQMPAATLVRDVRVFDGERVSEHRSVLIEGGKISQVGGPTLTAAGAEVVDGKGRTLLPGLIDSHVHIADQAESISQQALLLGVTTQLDMFSAGDRLKGVKKVETEDRPDLADVRTAGNGATVPGGHPTQMGGPAFDTISGPEQAQAFVDARIAEGSDYIKILLDDGSTWPWKHQPVAVMNNETLRALVEAAHRRGKLAVVHVLAEQQARDAIQAGADGLAHLFLGDSASADFGKFAASHHVFVIPTLTTLHMICGKPSGAALSADPHLAKYIAEKWRGSINMSKADPSANHLCKGTDEAMRQLIQARVPILTGTDAPAPGSTYGASVHGELELLVGDGMTPVQALAAATSVPAKCFRLSDRGWIRPGMRADLVLVEGDPTRDILKTREIVGVWKRGFRLQRQE